MFFECFLFFCVLILQFFVITTLLTDCRGHWRVSLLLCAYELHGLLVLSGVRFLDVVGQPSCSRPFLVVAVSGRPLDEVFAGSSISCLHQAQNVLLLMVGANLLTYRQTQAVNFLRPAICGWIVTGKLLLFPLTVVSAVFGVCKTASVAHPHPPDSNPVLTRRQTHQPLHYYY